MTQTKVTRRELLQGLIELTAPPEEIAERLSRFEWDSEEELVTLESTHLRAVLEKFIDGSLPAGTVETWANALEGREDIRISEASPAGDILFELANPVLQGELTRERAKHLLKKLR